MPFVFAPWPVTVAGLGAAFAGAVGGGLSGADVGALIGAITGAGALLFSVIWNNRSNRRADEADKRQRALDLLAAEARGEDHARAEMQPWLDYYKELAQGRLRLPPEQMPPERQP